MKINPVISQKISAITEAAKNTAKKVKGQLTPENISKVKNEIRSSKFVNDVDKFTTSAKAQIKTISESDKIKELAESAQNLAETAKTSVEHWAPIGLDKAKQIAKNAGTTAEGMAKEAAKEAKKLIGSLKNIK